jgi:hypothetical protein
LKPPIDWRPKNETEIEKWTRIASHYSFADLQSRNSLLMKNVKPNDNDDNKDKDKENDKTIVIN